MKGNISFDKRPRTSIDGLRWAMITVPPIFSCQFLERRVLFLILYLFFRHDLFERQDFERILSQVHWHAININDRVNRNKENLFKSVKNV